MPMTAHCCLDLLGELVQPESSPRWFGRFYSAQVFNGDYLEVARVTQRTLENMYERHPERFSSGRPIVQMPPTEVCIKPGSGGC